METLDLVAMYRNRIRVANVSLNGGDLVVRAKLIIPRALVGDYKKHYRKDRVDPNEFWLDLDLMNRLRRLPSESGWKYELDEFFQLVRSKYKSIEAKFLELEPDFGVNPKEEIALEIKPTKPIFHR